MLVDEAVRFGCGGQTATVKRAGHVAQVGDCEGGFVGAAAAGGLAESVGEGVEFVGPFEVVCLVG